MGKIYSEIDDRLQDFIAAQRVFFVATAPAGDTGHVNCSPKGLTGLRVLGPTRVAYLDFVGSGAETIAHIRENRRVTLLLCAFEGSPKILRLQGSGAVLEPGDAEFAELAPSFDVTAHAGVRSIVRVDLTRISDSCGYGVPRYRYEGGRDQLSRWATKKGPEGLLAYQRQKNAHSVDDLPALRWVTSAAHSAPVAEDARFQLSPDGFGRRYGPLDAAKASRKEVCFVATDKAFLVDLLHELSQRDDCHMVKYSVAPRGGMYLGRCVLGSDRAAAELCRRLEPHPKLMVTLQDDEVFEPFRWLR